MRRLAVISASIVLLLASIAAPMPAAAYDLDVVSPREIRAMAADLGYSAITRPRLMDDLYVVIASDRRSRRVRLVFDAFDGNLIDREVIGRAHRRPEPQREPRWVERDRDQFGRSQARLDDGDDALFDEPQRRSRAGIDDEPLPAKPKPPRKKIAVAPDDAGDEPLLAPGPAKAKPKPPGLRKPDQPAKKKPVAAAPVEDLIDENGTLLAPPKTETAKPETARPETATAPAIVPADPAPTPAVAKPPAVPRKKVTVPADETQADVSEEAAAAAGISSADAGTRIAPRVIPIMPPTDLDVPAPPALRQQQVVPPAPLE